MIFIWHPTVEPSRECRAAQLNIFKSVTPHLVIQSEQNPCKENPLPKMYPIFLAPNHSGEMRTVCLVVQGVYLQEKLTL